jgi:hypothetical protein
MDRLSITDQRGVFPVDALASAVARRLAIRKEPFPIELLVDALVNRLTPGSPDGDLERSSDSAESSGGDLPLLEEEDPSSLRG